VSLAARRSNAGQRVCNGYRCAVFLTVHMDPGRSERCCGCERGTP
jgi:hypothetical protein